MRQLIKEQTTFFSLFTIFLIIGGILLLNIEKGDAILFFSENRSVVGDFFFRWTTKLGEIFPYLFGVLLFIYRKNYPFAIAIPILVVLVTLVAYVSKTYFAHYRPATFFEAAGIFEQLNLVEGVKLNKGASSFPSGHTMSAFATYAFISFAFPNKNWIGMVCFILALIVGISRIYLVQHFLQDVFLGAIIGTILAILVFLGLQYLLSRRTTEQSPQP